MLEDEVSPDSCSAKRSQTTGHLLLDLPKAKPVLRAQNAASPKPQVQKNVDKATTREVIDRGHGASNSTAMDGVEGEKGLRTFTKFQNTNNQRKNNTMQSQAATQDFEDDPDVPSLI